MVTRLIPFTFTMSFAQEEIRSTKYEETFRLKVIFLVLGQQQKILRTGLSFSASMDY